MRPRRVHASAHHAANTFQQALLAFLRHPHTRLVITAAALARSLVRGVSSSTRYIHCVVCDRRHWQRCGPRCQRRHRSALVSLRPSHLTTPAH